MSFLFQIFSKKNMRSQICNVEYEKTWLSSQTATS